MVNLWIHSSKHTNKDNLIDYLWFESKLHILGTKYCDMGPKDIGGTAYAGGAVYANQCLFLSLSAWVALPGRDIYEASMDFRRAVMTSGNITDFGGDEDIGAFVDKYGIDVFVYDLSDRTGPSEGSAKIFCVGEHFRPDHAAYILAVPGHYMPFVLP